MRCLAQPFLVCRLYTGGFYCLFVCFAYTCVPEMIGVSQHFLSPVLHWAAGVSALKRLRSMLTIPQIFGQPTTIISYWVTGDVF